MTLEPDWAPVGSGTRQQLVDAAAELRTALTAQLDFSRTIRTPSTWPQVSQLSNTARKRFERARAALPREDRLARRLADQWQQVAQVTYHRDHLGLQTTEDVAWAFLQQLASDECPRWAPRAVYRSANAVPPGDWLIDGWRDLAAEVALLLARLPRFAWEMARLGWHDGRQLRRG